MAPTVCMTDFPETGNSRSCNRQRHKLHDGSISKRQKVELKTFSSKASEVHEMILSHPLGPISRTRCLTDSYVPIILRSQQILTMTSSEQENQWKMALRRDGLLDIFIRTIALMRRNHILQKRVNALHEETQSFISTMINEEGNEAQNVEDIFFKDNSQVSSSTEDNSRSTSPCFLDSRTDPDSDQVSSSSEISSQEC